MTLDLTQWVDAWEHTSPLHEFVTGNWQTMAVVAVFLVVGFTAFQHLEELDEPSVSWRVRAVKCIVASCSILVMMGGWHLVQAFRRYEPTVPDSLATVVERAYGIHDLDCGQTDPWSAGCPFDYTRRGVLPDNGLEVTWRAEDDTWHTGTIIRHGTKIGLIDSNGTTLTVKH